MELPVYVVCWQTNAAGSGVSKVYREKDKAIAYCRETQKEFDRFGDYREVVSPDSLSPDSLLRPIFTCTVGEDDTMEVWQVTPE